MKTRNAALITLIGIVALALMACSPPAVVSADPLEGTSWELTTYRGTRPIEGTTITANFEDGQVRGSSGCNTYFGSYEVNGGTINMGQIAMTEMACLEPEGSMEQEMVYLEFLGEAKSFLLTAGGLQILGPEGKALTFVPAA
jgi:heat shock protein HslJ